MCERLLDKGPVPMTISSWETPPVLLTFEAEAEDVTTDDVVSRVLGAVKVP